MNQMWRTRLPLILFVVGIFCLFAFVSQRDVGKLAALRERGIEGRGAVTGLWQNTGGGRRAFGVYYSFEVARRSYGGLRPVPESYHMRASVGTPVMVTYLPENPDNHYVGRVDDALLTRRRDNQILGLSIVGAVSVLLLALILRRSSARRDVRLA
jgi:hypothetical protein